MRASLWLATISAVASVAAAVVAAGAGCSSSSAAPPVDDASVDTGIDDAAASPVGDGSCSVDASLAMLATSDAATAACASCVSSRCMDAIHTCAGDCTCINFFSCVAEAGLGTTMIGVSNYNELALCVPNGLPGLSALSGNPGLSGVLTCYAQTCASACLPPDDASDTEASAGDAASPEAIADAGAQGDAADAR